MLISISDCDLRRAPIVSRIWAVKILGVMTFAIVTGEFDCRVRVACRDQADLMRLVEELRSGGAIQGTNTTVNLREVEVRSTVF